MNKQEIFECLVSGKLMNEDVQKEFVKLVDEYYDKFYSGQFIARETGVSRRDLSVWNKEGLLLNRNDEEDDGWKKYSMIECFWLNIVWKLKKFGVSNTQIIEYKEILFDNSAKAYKDNIKEIERVSNFSSAVQHQISSIIQTLNNTEDDFIEDTLKDYNGSFGIILMFVSLFYLNYSLFILENGDIAVINVGEPTSEISEKNITSVVTKMCQQSFISINLKQIIGNFLQNEKLQKDTEFYFGILNHGEQKLITEIRSKKLKQVTVKIKDGSISHIRLTKNDKQNEVIIKQLSRLLKKGDYKKIELVAVDGKIAHFDEEDIIKM
jgi:DNA-binding transcriptional MerR regulator